MFDDLDVGEPSLSADEAFHILKELEQNTPEELRRQRAHFRLVIQAAAFLQSGNASQLLDFRVKGTTGDVSESGCCALFPIPAQVGDIYRLEFDRSVLDLPVTFGRCVRCRLVREEAYESGFRFFAPISLPQTLEVAQATGRAR